MGYPVIQAGKNNPLVDTDDQPICSQFQTPDVMETALAVDLGGTKIRAGMIDAEGTALAEESTSTPENTGEPGDLVRLITTLLSRVIRERPDEKPLGIGISAAGPVNFAEGILTNPPNIPCRDVPLKRDLSSVFHLPVEVFNDCHCGIIGESAFGALRGVRDAVYLTISTGIGAGVSSGGQLILGTAGNAAEVGHFKVDSLYDLPCACGYKGHWEGFASGRHIPRFFKKWRLSKGFINDFPDLDSQLILKMASEGKPEFVEFVHELTRINAIGLSNIIVAYDPGVIVLDGSVILHNQDLLLEPMLELTERYLPLPRVQVTDLNGRAPLLGASVVGRGREMSPLAIRIT